MEFNKPNKRGFTIYSKSGCPNCLKTKILIKGKNLVMNVIDCDEYIIEDKPSFLSFINSLAKKEITTFPIVFYEEQFIGGYTETLNFVPKLLLSFEENFSY